MDAIDTNNFTKDSLKFRTNDGKTLGDQDKVSLTGEVLSYQEQNSDEVTCFFTVKEINTP